MIYLNVGHTGLDQPGLVSWLARKGARAVYLIHDLIPITHPHYCRPGEAAKHRLRTQNALVSATGLICNSALTQNSLADFARDIGVGMPRSIVAWISSPPLAVATGPKLLDRPYFVALGTIEGRKNHLLLLKIWDSLATSMGNDAPILVIIGQRGWEAQAAIAILDQPGRLQDHVYELRHCTDHELANWLSGARALLMPSFAEGFGLPVTEAMQLRIPVIASDLPVYREIAGEIPTYLDPLDAVGWEQAIKDFMGDSAERARQLSRLQHYRAPDWRTHFATVEAWLRRL
jgi:glycosyltransferase involved in cell wall biosynthesis